jgi:hypothetical protein
MSRCLAKLKARKGRAAHLDSVGRTERTVCLAAKITHLSPTQERRFREIRGSEISSAIPLGAIPL